MNLNDKEENKTSLILDSWESKDFMPRSLFR